MNIFDLSGLQIATKLNCPFDIDENVVLNSFEVHTIVFMADSVMASF